MINVVTRMPHKNGMWISKGFSKVITGGNGYGIL